MSTSTFSPATFFDLSHFRYKDVFNESQNVWEAIRHLDAYLLDQFRSGKIKANFNNSTDICLGKDVIIEEGAKIQGPAIIGDGSFIGHSALIRGGCIIGDRVHIGHAVEIKHSLLLNNAIAAHLNYIGDSIVGEGVNISGGTICANFRLDKNTVNIKYEKERIDTGLAKLGAIIGDRSNIGVNSVLNPGTVLLPGSVVYPLTSVSGFREGVVKSD